MTFNNRKIEGEQVKKLLLLLFFCASSAYANATLFTEANCTACEEVKNYLHSKGVRFQICDISNSYCLETVSRLGGQSVPFLLINDKKIEGFSAEDIDEALGH